MFISLEQLCGPSCQSCMRRVKQEGRGGFRKRESERDEGDGRRERRRSLLEETQHQANFPRLFCYLGRANISDPHKRPHTAGTEYSSNKTHLKTHLRSTAAQTLFRPEVNTGLGTNHQQLTKRPRPSTRHSRLEEA